MSPRRRRPRLQRKRRGLHGLLTGPINTEAMGGLLLIAIPTFFLFLLFLGPGLNGATDWSRPAESLANGGTTLLVVLGAVGLLALIVWWKTR
jgi:hypothetical protein